MKPEKGYLIEVLRIKHGNLSEVARSFKVSRQAVYDWIGDDPEYKAVLDEARERTCDMAEGILMKRMRGKNEAVSLKAAQYYLDTQAKHRGYGTKKIDHMTTSQSASDFEYMTIEELEASIQITQSILNGNHNGAN